MKLVAATFIAAMTAIFGGCIVAGATGSWILGALAGATASALSVRLVWRGPFGPSGSTGTTAPSDRPGPLTNLDPAAASRGLLIVSALAAALAIVQYGRLAVFMADASRTEFSFAPGSAWETRHSCTTAYFVAAGASERMPNIYADSLYTAPDDDPTAIRKARELGRFKVDVYEYPPTFLLLPRALRVAAPNFDRFRLLWFGFEGAVVLFGLVFVARSLGGAAGTRALLLAPLVLAAIPTVSAMQKGNVQQVVIAASMIAMVLLARGRRVAGGALLAFATASKLYPGLLIVYLIARRELRSVAWTAVWGLALIAATVATMGTGAYTAFMEHLPGLMSGEAFPAFRNPAAVAINHSIPGLVFKLKLFGGPALSFGAAKVVGWIYTAVAVGLAIWAARRASRAPGETALIWMAILIIATLRSPFLPQAYSTIPPLWLLTLLGAVALPGGKGLGVLLLGWAALSVYVPTDLGVGPRALALLHLAPQAATIAVTVIALLRLRKREPAP
jgi:hypothetical protein